MKELKTWLLCLIILLPANILAQYADGIYRLYYSNSSGESGLTTYIYDCNDLPYKAIWELRDGSRSSVNQHEFDDNANMIRKYREFSDSITVEQLFSYNSKQQLIRETFNRSDGVSGTVSYIYDNEKCVFADCKGLNGWYYGNIIYEYNDNEERVSATLKTNDIENGNISYEYNESGKLIKELWTFNNGFSQTLIYEYKDTRLVEF